MIEDVNTDEIINSDTDGLINTNIVAFNDKNSLCENIKMTNIFEKGIIYIPSYRV